MTKLEKFGELIEGFVDNNFATDSCRGKNGI